MALGMHSPLRCGAESWPADSWRDKLTDVLWHGLPGTSPQEEEVSLKPHFVFSGFLRSTPTSSLFWKMSSLLEMFLLQGKRSTSRIPEGKKNITATGLRLLQAWLRATGRTLFRGTECSRSGRAYRAVQWGPGRKCKISPRRTWRASFSEMPLSFSPSLQSLLVRTQLETFSHSLPFANAKTKYKIRILLSVEFHEGTFKSRCLSLQLYPPRKSA